MTTDDRWIEVSRSAFAHEAEGLGLLRQIVPPSSPYRAWTNFEFMDSHGGWNEIDALILGRSRLHLVELKSYTGVLSGNERTWTLTGPSGHSRTQRSALLTTRHKAQKLASRIKEEARKVAADNGLDPEKVLRALPFIQESVFFHGARFTTNLSDLAKSNLFGIDGNEDSTGLPGISGRLLEPPRSGREPYGEDLSVIVAVVLRALGAARRTDRDAGSWALTGSPIDSGDDWQEFRAVHKVTGDRGVGRVVAVRRGTPEQARMAAHRRIQREYTLINALHQESIVPPRDIAVDDDGNTVLVYPELDGFEPLDLALATRTLTADQQVAVLGQVADALAYAHRNQVANRGLSPSSVLIGVASLDGSGAVAVRLADWSWAGRIHGSGTASPTLVGSDNSGGGAAHSDVYQAPEDRWSADADRAAADLFSLGALAYFLLAAEQPAPDRADLLARLRADDGLDLAAAGGRFVDEELRQVVLRATRPTVTERIDADPKTGMPRFGVAEFRAALERFIAARLAPESPEADPLNPMPQELLAGGRFEVVKVLGSGSTARGVLVLDHENESIRRVLKVGLNDDAAARLHEEAAVLVKLGDRRPAVPGVVELVEPPMEISGRTVLLLTDCGEQTLSDLVRYTNLNERQLKTWGTGLLDTVVALDEAGIVHRDIKPSNLGMARTRRRGKRDITHLALFDFSLSRAGVTAIEAGTPPYRDPFLGTGTRTAFDSAAERYSAAVVLYEMATAGVPVYGDGLSDPRAINDDVSVDAGDFVEAGHAPVRAAALAGFFRRALARDARRRHDTSAAMRKAWLDVFTASANDVAEAPVRPDTHGQAGIVVEVSDVEVSDEPAGIPIHRSLQELLDDLRAAAGRRPQVSRRQVLELVLGVRDDSPADPFVVYSDYAARLDVTPGRIAQIFGEFPSLLQTGDDVRAARVRRLAATITDLRLRLQRVLEAAGGASTPQLVARELVADLQTADVDDLPRVSLGLLRFVLACESRLADSGAEPGPTIVPVEMVRRHGAGTAAMLATPAVDRRLPAALARRAEQLVDDAVRQGASLVAPAEAEGELRRAAATVLGVEPAEVELRPQVLLGIAATASPELALTSRGELHSAGLSAEQALRVVLQGLSNGDTFGRPELEARLGARFPALSGALPRRPKLDELVEAIAPGMTYDERTARYGFPASAPSRGSTLPTNRGTGHPGRSGLRPGSARWAAIDGGERRFRALGVPVGKSDEVAAALAERFGATHIDVADVLLAAMRDRAAAVGLPWDAILAADAGGAADREGLRGFVAQVAPAVVTAVDAVDGPVVVTGVSALAAYGQLGVIAAWTDLSSPPAHSIWVVLPQQSANAITADGVALPLNSPEQSVPLTDADVRALVAKESSTR